MTKECPTCKTKLSKHVPEGYCPECATRDVAEYIGNPKFISAPTAPEHPQAIFDPAILASPADILRHEKPILADKPPPGYHLPFPGFIHFGHYMPQRDINALHHLASRLFFKHGALKIAEVGSFTGSSTIALANYAGLLYCIDTWSGGTDQADKANVAYATHGSAAIVNAFIRNTSHLSNIMLCEWHDRFWIDWQDGSLDMIFIDGDHTYEAVKRDIYWATRIVRSGGIICGHDYDSSDFPGVTTAVHEALGNVNVLGNVWWK